MGCDIHAFLEYRRASDERLYWRAFSGELNLDRNYEVFGSLAGVRRERPHVTPRGVPEPMSMDADGEYWTWIDYENPELVAEAERCVRAGYSKTRGLVEKTVTNVTTFGFGGPAQTETRVRDEAHVGKPRFYSDADAHTPSWLTIDEFEAALEGCEYVQTYRAVVAAARVLEQAGNICRVVFWFDN